MMFAVPWQNEIEKLADSDSAQSAREVEGARRGGGANRPAAGLHSAGIIWVPSLPAATTLRTSRSAGDRCWRQLPLATEPKPKREHCRNLPASLLAQLAVGHNRYDQPAESDAPVYTADRNCSPISL